MQQLVRFATTQQRARASCYVMKYDKKSTSVTNPDQFGANFLLNSEKKVTKHVKWPMYGNERFWIPIYF